MTNSINLAALGFGGIDTSSLLSGLVGVEQQPITQMQTQQSQIQAASSTISSFSSSLSALKNAAVVLADPTTFQAMKATSSDPSVVATASGSPAAGQWSMSVSSVAAAQRSLSNGTADSTSALGLSGNLVIDLGSGSTATVTLTMTDSLSAIATKIASSGLHIQAQVMSDGTQSHLLVSGLDTGAANTISFDESGLQGTGYSLGLSSPSAVIQSAQDAKLTVGGVAITSSTNQVTNAIPGVTLALTQPTTSPVTVSIAGDSSGLQTEIQSFVSAYNDVINAGHTDSGFGSTAASNSILQGDSAIRSSLDQLGQLAGEQVAGTSGAYTTLGSIGLNLNTDGTMTFDATTFAAAIQADPTSVQRLFVTDSSTGATGIMGTIGTAVDSLTDSTQGPLAAEMQGMSARSTSLGSQISDAQQRLAAYQTQLQTQFTQMNTLLAQYKQTSQALTQASGTSSSSTTNTVL